MSMVRKRKINRFCGSGLVLTRNRRMKRSLAFLLPFEEVSNMVLETKICIVELCVFLNADLFQIAKMIQMRV